MKLYVAPILIIMTLACVMNLFAQQSADELDSMMNNDKIESKIENDSINNDIIRVNYDKKNAGLAMLMSGLIPGAGQFYVDKSAISAYIYPIIELAVIGGIVYYNSQGNKKVKEYKKYANGETVSYEINGYTYVGTRYRRDFQSVMQDSLKYVHSYDIYDNSYFSLDSSDSQHFYEDIGKYNKYIFGWADWYLTYAEAGVNVVTNPNPDFEWSLPVTDSNWNSPSNLWLGNYPLNGPHTWAAPTSELRTKYIQMRQAAEDKYRVANYLSFGIAFNHIISAIDAARMTSNRNRLYLSESKVKVNYYAALNNGFFTPMLGMTYKF